MSPQLPFLLSSWLCAILMSLSLSMRVGDSSPQRHVSPGVDLPSVWSWAVRPEPGGGCAGALSGGGGLAPCAHLALGGGRAQALGGDPVPSAPPGTSEPFHRPAGEAAAQRSAGGHAGGSPRQGRGWADRAFRAGPARQGRGWADRADRAFRAGPAVLDWTWANKQPALCDRRRRFSWDGRRHRTGQDGG